jgi:hypothetical protein
VEDERRAGEDPTYARALWPGLEHLDPTFREILRMSVHQVWYAGVVQWASGQKSLKAVHRDVERLVRFLFEQDSHIQPVASESADRGVATSDRPR